MNSPTWAQGTVPLLLQALLSTGQGSFLGAWLGYAGRMLALENSGALGTLRRVVGKASEEWGWEAHLCPTGSASFSLEPGAEVPERVGGRQHLEPWGRAGCPASSLGPY